jgi:hypothetical protein
LAGCRGFDAASVILPLELLRNGADAPPISFGPIDLPGAGGSLRLRFRSDVPSDGMRVIRVGDTVELPLTFGDDQTVPERIDLRCQQGELTMVRYRRADAVHEFAVSRRADD